MPDILSQGQDRKRGLPWARLAVVAAVLIALTVVIVQNYPRHRHPARPRSASSTQAPAALPAPGLPGGPDGVAGPSLPWQAAVRLPVTGPQPSWYWPATGRIEPVGGLPLSRPGYQFTRVSGGWAVQPNAPGPSCGDGCAAGPVPAYYVPDSGRAAHLVGVASQVAPAATGAVWLTTFQAGARLRTASGTARQVSVDGGPAGPPVQLPAGYVIVQGTDRGLLLAPAEPGAGLGYLLWNPSDRRVIIRLSRVIAAGPHEIAWASGCAPDCRARVLNVATGRSTVVTLPRGSSAASGSFSPDGRLLALQLSLSPGGAGGSLAMELDVASTASGRLTRVPGTFASSDALVGFGWPGGGHSLVAELSFTTKVQLASWQPGATRLAVALVAPGPATNSLILG